MFGRPTAAVVLVAVASSSCEDERQLYSVFEPPPPVREVPCQADGAPSPWIEVSSPVPNGLADIWGTSATDIWAVGGFGTMLHYDGADWTDRSESWGVDLMGVHGLGPNDVWVVGRSGLAAHFDGTMWTPVTTGTDQILTDVWAVDSDDVWMVGAEGIRRWNGSAVVREQSWPDGSMHAVWASGPADVVVVGDSSSHRFDGARFITEPVQNAGRLTAVWGTDTAHVWVLGHNVSERPGFGVREGDHWAFAAAPPRSFFFSLWGQTPRQMWAGADRTTIFLYRDGEWCREYLGGVGVAASFWGASHDDVWAVGAENGPNDVTLPVLLRRQQ